MVLRSLYSKISLTIVGMLILSVVSVGTAAYFITKSSLEKSQKTEMEFYAGHFKNDLVDDINIREQRLYMISEGEQFRTYHYNYRDIVLRKYFQQFADEFPVLSYVNDDGYEEVKVVNGRASEVLRDLSNETIFENSTWDPNSVVMESVVKSSELGGAAMRFACTRISYFGDEFIGMLVAQVPFSYISEYLSSIKIGDQGNVSLIDRNGLLLASSRDDIQGSTFSESAELIAGMNKGGSGFMRSNIFGRDSYFSFMPVEGTTWTIVVSLPYAEFNAVTDKLMSTVLAVSSMIFFLLLLAASLVSKRIVDPIRDMEKASRDIAGGDFTKRVRYSSNDEIGEFAGAFNAMMDKVNEFSNCLVQEKKYVENLMGSMLNAIIVMDMDMNIIDVNESACTMIDYSRDELISQPLNTILKEDMGTLKSRLLKEQSVRNMEKMFVKKLGDMIYALISFSIVEGNEGEYDRILCVAEDITEIKVAEELLRKSHDEMEAKVHERTAALMEVNKELEEEIVERSRAEENLVRMNEILEKRNRELQEFAYVASHDLQEPLRKITTFGDRLRNKCSEGLGEQGNDYLTRMQSAAGRMHDLITSLLMFSRVTTRALPFSQVDLNRVAQEVVSDLEILIDQSGGTVEVAGLATIEADSFQMHQVLQNLISNALKFRKEELAPVVKVYGKVVYENGSGFPAEKRQELYQLFVEDNGIGFDEKYLERIFGVFQRLHGRKEYEGTGIGLSICRKIAERHGGSITAVSSPGEGASFIVTLPVRHPE